MLRLPRATRLLAAASLAGACGDPGVTTGFTTAPPTTIAETGSTGAEELLADWPPSAARFTKVMPKDYKRVLEAMERAREEGVDVDEAVMASVAPPASSTTTTAKKG